MTINDALECYLRFPDGDPPSARDKEMLAGSWQAGVERLGYLFVLPEPVVMTELLPLVEGFLATSRGADIPAHLPTVEDPEAVIAALADEAAHELVPFELGAVVGEAAVECGWTWCRSDEDGLLVRAPNGFGLHAFELVQGILGGRTPGELLSHGLLGLLKEYAT